MTGIDVSAVTYYSKVRKVERSQSIKFHKLIQNCKKANQLVRQVPQDYKTTNHKTKNHIVNLFLKYIDIIPSYSLYNTYFSDNPSYTSRTFHPKISSSITEYHKYAKVLPSPSIVDSFS